MSWPLLQIYQERKTMLCSRTKPPFIGTHNVWEQQEGTGRSPQVARNLLKCHQASRNLSECHQNLSECAHWMGGERARNLSGARRFRALLAHLALLGWKAPRHFPPRPAPKPRWVKDTALESCCLAESLESLIFIQNIDHPTTGKSKVS